MSPNKKARIVKRDGCCLRCGAKEHLSVDHVIPTSLGGTDDEDNLQTLCLTCNAHKGNRSTDDYRISGAAGEFHVPYPNTMTKKLRFGERVRVMNFSLRKSTIQALADQSKIEDRPQSRIANQGRLYT